MRRRRADGYQTEETLQKTLRDLVGRARTFIPDFADLARQHFGPIYNGPTSSGSIQTFDALYIMLRQPWETSLATTETFWEAWPGYLASDGWIKALDMAADMALMAQPPFLPAREMLVELNRIEQTGKNGLRYLDDQERPAVPGHMPENTTTRRSSNIAHAVRWGFMFTTPAIRRRARRALGPWMLAGMGLWIALDNAPAIREEWRVRQTADSAVATVLSVSGSSPQRAIRRLWDDLFWGRGRRVTYQFAAPDTSQQTGTAFVTHRAADSLRQGSNVEIRYVATNPAVQITGEPGILLLTFRTLIGLMLVLLSIILLRGRHSRSKIAPASSRLQA